MGTVRIVRAEDASQFDTAKTHFEEYAASLGVDLSRLEHPRFRRIESISPRNHVHHFRLTTPSEVDTEFRRWLREAYAVGAQEHLQAGRGG